MAVQKVQKNLEGGCRARARGERMDRVGWDRVGWDVGCHFSSEILGVKSRYRGRCARVSYEGLDIKKETQVFLGLFE